MHRIDHLMYLNGWNQKCEDGQHLLWAVDIPWLVHNCAHWSATELLTWSRPHAPQHLVLVRLLVLLTREFFFCESTCSSFLRSVLA